MDNKYTKLSALVDSTFKIEKVWGYKFKMWDKDNNKMLVSETWVADHRKLYDVDTDKGKLDISSAQMGQILEAWFENGVSNIVGKSIYVKSNGKPGMEIRYFLNRAEPAKAVLGGTDVAPPPDTNVDEINLDDIPY